VHPRGNDAPHAELLDCGPVQGLCGLPGGNTFIKCRMPYLIQGPTSVGS
jgi:hypothetical protein